MSKVISINPDLFSASGKGGTRKKTPKTDINIKVRQPNKNENNKTTKRALLKYIRNQQEKNLEKKINSENTPILNKPRINEVDNFNTDFNESLKFLTNISEQNKTNQSNNQKTNYNQTLRRPILYNTAPTLHGGGIEQSNCIIPILDEPQLPESNTYLGGGNYSPIPTPKYGCLKNGNLPTYRSWQNTTQKNYNLGGSQPISNNQYTSNNQPALPTNNQPISYNQYTSNNQPALPTNNQPISHNQYTTNNQFASPNQQTISTNNQFGGSSREHFLNQNIRKMSEIKQSIEKSKEVKKHKLYYPKQKKTIRRTYNVGKSKVFPKISVLISNKTIRNDISTKTQYLKQMPIEDVKKYLIKHGFIRIGSTSPNDVLRKMYESALLICGNINNHNPDNLLYNFLNDSSSHA
jgi:hypothetical protein